MVQYLGNIFGIGTSELLLILVIVLLLFGGAKLPGLFRSAGQSIHELRKGLDGNEAEEKKKHSKPAGTKKA